MRDLVVIAVVIAFFAISGALIRFADALSRTDR